MYNHFLLLHKTIFRWLLLMTLVTALPVQAVDYNFPGLLPTGCSVNSSVPNSFDCGGLTLAADDTITIITKPTTINFSGVFNTGARTIINAGGSPADLTLNLNGVLNVGIGSKLVANVIDTAAVNLGDNSVVGNITTTAGVVTIGADNTIGKISTGDGGINIGNNSQVAAISSLNGVITLLNTVTVNGDISSGAGAVNIESYSRVCGNINVTGAGVVTLTTYVKVGGNITTIAGAVTISNGSTVNGSVIITGAGVLTMTAVQVGGNIATTAGAITLTDTKVGGTVTSSGAGVVTTTGSTTNDTNLSVPLACAAASTPGTPVSGSTATGLFDCLETGINASSLYTKLAGTAFSVDIAALKADKTLNSNYVATGGLSKYTRVELFDDTMPPASCSAYTSPVAVQTATFTSSSGGRTPTVGVFNLPSVYKKLRCRVTECTDSSCRSATAEQSCSSDQFSVRPTNFTVTSTTATADNTGTSGTAGPVIKAGANFNLTATSVAGYTGTPLLDVTKLLAHSGAVSTGSLTGSFTAANILFGVASNSSFAYSEVGYFALTENGVYDSTFAAVDSSNSDCTADFSNTAVGGKYGCYFGNSVQTNYFGRFIPDHFALTPGTAVPACGTFSYFGQDGFKTPFTLTAQNLGNSATQNYTGLFAKLSLSAWSDFVFTGVSLPAGATLSASATSPTGSWNNGVAIVTAKHQLSRPTALTGETNVVVQAKPRDIDGVTMTAANVASAPTPLRYGRLSLQNAYGSELLDLPIPVTAQYWNGSSFVTNDLDSCTKLADSNIGYGNYQAPLTADNIGALTFRTADSNGSCSASSVPSGVMISGKSCILLSQPAASSATGSVDLLINLGSLAGNCLSPALSSGSSAGTTYLSGNWCGTGYDRDPTARATFGIYKDRSRLIYFREVY